MIIKEIRQEKRKSHLNITPQLACISWRKKHSDLNLELETNV